MLMYNIKNIEYNWLINHHNINTLYNIVNNNIDLICIK